MKAKLTYLFDIFVDEMMHYLTTKIFFVCLVIFFVTCTPKSDDLPEGILNKEVMIDVITDLQLLDAAQRSFSTGSIETSKMRDTSYAIVFNKYDSRQFYFINLLETTRI